MPFPIERKYIEETENTLGVIFPETYKEKMILQNGGELFIEGDDWQLFPFFSKLNKETIRRTCNDIISETKARGNGAFPDKVIAIGTNGSGDYLVFKISNTNEKLLDDQIYFWNHETCQLKEVMQSFNKER